MKRMGRPPLEGKAMGISLHVRLTDDMAAAIDKKKGDMSRVQWVRELIKRGLK